jgi:hypothetical protein
MKRRPGDPLSATEAIAARAAREARWEVQWCNFREHHDFVGRMPARSGGLIKPKRRPPPPVQRQRFNTRAGAVEFVAKLRDTIPSDELVVQIIDRHQSKSPPAATTPLFPGSWPLQRRS